MCGTGINGLLHVKAVSVLTYYILCFICCLPGSTSGLSGSPISLTQDDITAILNRINTLRNTVSPPASNMNRLYWNENLAAAAERFSLNCRLELNLDLSSQEFSSVGQIWSAAGSSILNFTTIIDGSWIRPRSSYSYTANTCSSPGACTNYTQLIRAVSTDIGCAAALCPTIRTFPVPNSIIYICYFGPKGDPSSQPYETDIPCSACANDQVCNKSLCEKQMISTNNVSTNNVSDDNFLHVTSGVIFLCPQLLLFYSFFIVHLI